MEYRFGTLGDYLWVSKGCTGVLSLNLGTSNIQHRTPNVECSVVPFHNLRPGTTGHDWARLWLILWVFRRTTRHDRSATHSKSKVRSPRSKGQSRMCWAREW